MQQTTSQGGTAHSAALIESSCALVSSLEGRARTLDQSPISAVHLPKSLCVSREPSAYWVLPVESGASEVKEYVSHQILRRHA